MAFDFPTGVPVGTEVTGTTGATYYWDGVKWYGAGAQIFQPAPPPPASDVVPAMDGVGAPGASVFYSRGDHRHPTDATLTPLAGGSMTGPLALYAGSTAPLVTPPTDSSPKLANTQFVQQAIGVAVGTGGGGGGPILPQTVVGNPGAVAAPAVAMTPTQAKGVLAIAAPDVAPGVFPLGAYTIRQGANTPQTQTLTLQRFTDTNWDGDLITGLNKAGTQTIFSIDTDGIGTFSTLFCHGPVFSNQFVAGNVTGYTGNPTVLLEQDANSADTIFLQRAQDTTPYGWFLRGVNAASNTTLFDVDVTGAAYFTSVITGALQANSLTVNGAISFPGSMTTGLIWSRQPVNGGDTHLLLRQTDSGPSGWFLRGVNAANSAELFHVDVLGAASFAGVVATGNITTTATMQAAVGTFNNMAVFPGDNTSGIYLRRGTDTAPSGNFLIGNNAANTQTLFAVDVNGFGTFNGGAAATQRVNGGDTVILNRATDAGPAGNYIRFRNAANTADVASMDVNGGLYVVAVTSGSLTVNGGVTLNGPIYVETSAGQTIQVMNGPPATPKVIYFQTNANNHWHLGQDAVAEGGSNGGGNFAIARYTDAGGIIDVPLYILRSNGVVYINTALQVGAPTGETVSTAVAVKQIANGTDMFYGQRATDTAASGYFLRLRNTANTADLAYIDASGFIVTNAGMQVTGTMSTFGANGWLAAAGNVQTYPPANGGIYMSWNRSNGAGEGVLFNTFQNATSSFNFFQMTAVGAGTLVGSLSLTGANLPQGLITTSISVGAGVAIPINTNATIAARQIAVGQDTIFLQRRSDGTPTGYFLRCVDAANTVTMVSIDLNGNMALNYGGITATGSITAPVHYIDANYYLQMGGANSPIINFDANDYLMYSRSSNALSLLVAGATRLYVDATGLQVPNGLSAVRRAFALGPLNFLPASGAGSTCLLGGNQIANGDDTIVMQRTTDTAPTGQFMRGVNAANNQNIFMIDVNGVATVAALVTPPISLANLNILLPTPPTGTRAFINDCTGTTFAGNPVGGGNKMMPVFYNGTAWLIG